MSLKHFLRENFIRIFSVTSFIGIVMFISCYQTYEKRRSDTIIYSQYTFEIRLDSDYNIIDRNISYSSDNTKSSDWIKSVSLVDASGAWMNAYLNQMTGRYVPNVKALKNCNVTDVNVINADENIVLIAFSAEARNYESDYFDSWKGYVADGKMMCEWVVKLSIENLYDGTACVSAESIRMPEEYGIETYVSKAAQQIAVENDVTESAENLYRYQFVDGKIQVTFDGAKKWTIVPAESAYLLNSYSNIEENGATSGSTIDDGQYYIDSESAAFIYGGTAINGKTVPLTVIYTKDRGNNWISTQVSSISNINFGYINFFSQDEGIIVIGYKNAMNNEASAIYRTTDGGENWLAAGETPQQRPIYGVSFINSVTGFVSYVYNDNAASSLYATFDGGKSFSPVTLDEQLLSENNDGRYQWNQVFIQPGVPYTDSSGRLTLMLSQSETSTYSTPTLSALYVSDNSGHTWKYTGLIDTGAGVK